MAFHQKIFISTSGPGPELDKEVSGWYKQHPYIRIEHMLLNVSNGVAYQILTYEEYTNEEWEAMLKEVQVGLREAGAAAQEGLRAGREVAGQVAGEAARRLAGWQRRFGGG